MIFAAIPPPPFGAIEIGSLSIRMYAVMLVTAGLLAGFGARWHYVRKTRADPETVDTAVFLAIAGLLLGSRIAYVLGNLDRFEGRPLRMFAVWEGGLAIYGGLVLGVILSVSYAVKKGLDIPQGFDTAAVVLPIGTAIGRWGNYFNQEVYGTPTTLPWALQVEAPFRMPGYETFSTFHPTFLYESLADLALFATLLWVDRNKTLRAGVLFALYLIGYGTIRFFIELIRIDTTIRIFGLSRNAYGSLAAVVIGAGVLMWQRRRAAEA